MSGYRNTGYFLYWLSQNKDKDFLRKFNRTALEVIPWSWDAAMHHILGPGDKNSVENLWAEYINAIGDDDEKASVRKQPRQDLSRYVNPLIGTEGFGNTAFVEPNVREVTRAFIFIPKLRICHYSLYNCRKS